MATSPMRPKSAFCHFGALTIGSKNAGAAISALEPAGDFEGHQARRFLEFLLGDHDVDLFESPGAAEIGHEVGDGGRGVGGSEDLEHPVAVLEPGDPQLTG